MPVAQHERHEHAVRLNSIRKVYDAASPVTALDDVDLTIPSGSFTAIMGPSGSGKSTLLHVAAGLDRPCEGRVFLGGLELAGDETAITKLRRRQVGFVFQQFNLLPSLTVLQNVLLPLRLARRKADVRRAREILDHVGLGDRLEHRPAELSGGEQQRVAITRALVGDLPTILADEPTGALDSKSARTVLGLLRDAAHGFGRTVVMVTHDPVAAGYADSVVFLADGRIVGRLESPTADAVAERMTHLEDEHVGGVAA